MSAQNITAVNTSLTCEEINITNYDVVKSALCGALCLFGLVYTFFGYRCFKAVMFLSGLIFGGTTVFMICSEERIFQQNVSIEVTIGISVGIGILCGFITMLVKYVGLFLQGFFLGVLVAFAGIIGMQSFYNPTTPWIPASILFGTGVLCSILTLKYQKKLIICSTAVFGGVLITLCIDYFIERFFLFWYAWEALMATPSFPTCWYTWVILAVWPALSLSGILIQWNVTSQGYDHTDVIIMQGRRKQVRTHLVRQHRGTVYSTVDRRPPTRRNTSVVGHSRSEHRPSRHQDAARVTPIANSVPQEMEATPSTSPPSYFECVELGVGEPLNEDHDVIRTELGAFVSRRSTPHHSNPTRNPLIEQLGSGEGYSLDSSQPSSSSGGYLAAASSRNPRPTRDRSHRPTEPDHQPIEQFAARSRPKRPNQAQKQPKASNKHRNQGGGARRYRVSPSGPPSGQSDTGHMSDTQLLLSDSSNARRHSDAIAAHAQRLHHAQVQRSTRPPLQCSDPSNAPLGGGDM